MQQRELEILAEIGEVCIVKMTKAQVEAMQKFRSDMTELLKS